MCGGFGRRAGWLISLQLGVCAVAAGSGVITVPPEGVTLISQHQFVIYRDASPERDQVFINGVRARPFDDEYRAWTRLLPGTNVIVVTEPRQGSVALLAARSVVYAPDPAYDVPMADGDGDGVVNAMDRFPYDPRVSLDPLLNGHGEPWIGGEAQDQIRRRLIELGVAPGEMLIEYGVVRTLTLREPTDKILSALEGLRIQTLTIRKGDALTDLSPLAGMPLETLNVSAPAVTNLAPLGHLPLTHLSLAHCRAIHDLTPLENLSLRHLDISLTAVSNLFPISGLPLRELVLNDTPVADLRPLVGMPIRRLSLDRTMVQDLRPLRSLPLETVSLHASIVTNGWDVLRHMPTLWQINQLAPDTFFAREPVLRREAAIRNRLPALARDYGWNERDLSAIWIAPTLGFHLNDRPIHDLTPLRGLPLAVLRIANTGVADLSPLRGMPLEILELRGTAVTDLSPLQGMPLKQLTLPGGDLPKGWRRIRARASLQSVDGIPMDRYREIEKAGLLALMPADPVSHRREDSLLRRLHPLPDGTWVLAFNTPAISNLPSLKGLPVSRLDLSGSGVTDLSPLQGARVRYLNASRTGIRSLTGLRRVPLRELDLFGTPVADLAGLEGMPLTRLSLSGTSVHDLTPLRGMPLEFLDLNGTPVADLSPLAGMPLKTLKIRGSRVTDLAPLAGVPLEFLVLDTQPVALGVDALRGHPTLKMFNQMTPEAFWTRFDNGDFHAQP